MPVGHVVKDDEGEFFDEDPTFGLGVAPDPVAEMKWKALAPIGPDEGSAAFSSQSVLTVVRESFERALAAKKGKEAAQASAQPQP